MSSYRPDYTSWKSSVTPLYKSTSSPRAYSSREEINTSRYTSLSSPISYRPSFSGGTYRIKRDPITVTPASSVYSSRSSVNLTSPSSSHQTSTLSKYGRSREPSPLALERTNRICSREISPSSSSSTRTSKTKSHDPSPVIDNKSKNSYVTASSYRLSSPRSNSSSSYVSRYGSANGIMRTPQTDKSISYLTASDASERSLKSKNARDKSVQSASHKTSSSLSSASAYGKITADTKSRDVTPTAVTTKEASVQNSDDSDNDSLEETFVSVCVVTRATSPTPPTNEKTVQRIRRTDIAKTVEKTVNRSNKRKELIDKEIQSDRLDDSTRYSRFGMNTRVSSSYSPHSDRGRYSSNNLRYNSSPLSVGSKSSCSPCESRKEYTSSSTTPDKNVRVTKGSLNNGMINTTKSKISPPKVLRGNSKNLSTENLISLNAANKPPAAPKSESPTKSTPCFTVNKDFRKSALNVGPTDRPRKSRTPSSGTDSDQHQQSADSESTNKLEEEQERKERSPSACSEKSTTSCNSNRRGSAENKLQLHIRQRCLNKTNSVNNTGTPVLSRNNSNLSIKNNSHRSCSTASSTSPETQTSANNVNGSTKKIKKKVGSTTSKLATPYVKKLTVTNGSDSTSQKSSGSSATNTDSEVISIASATPSDTESSCKVRELKKKLQSQHKIQPSRIDSSFSHLSSNNNNNNNNNNSSSSSNCSSSGSGSGSSSESSQEKNSSRNGKLSTDEQQEKNKKNDAKSESSDNFGSSFSETINVSLSRDTKSNYTPVLTVLAAAKSNNTTTTTILTTPNHTKIIASSSDSDTNSSLHNNQTTANLSLANQPNLADQSVNQSCKPIAKLSDKVTQDTDKQSNETNMPCENNNYWLNNDNCGDQTMQTNGQGHTDVDGHGMVWKITGHETNENNQNDGNCMPRKYTSPVNANNEQTVEVTISLPNASWSKTTNNNHNNNNINSNSSSSKKNELSSNCNEGKPLSDQKHWWLSGPDRKLFNISRIDSGEKAWWQEEDSNDVDSSNNTNGTQLNGTSDSTNHNADNVDAPYVDDAEVRTFLPHDKQYNHHSPTTYGNGDNSLASLNCEIGNSFYYNGAQRPPPLGQCASPVYHEEPLATDCIMRIDAINDRKSPYDNIPTQVDNHYMSQNHNYQDSQLQQQQQQQQWQHQHQKMNPRLFISRHENIDELLGGSCRPFRTQSNINEYSSPSDSINYFIEEVTPDQVRFHDSTAQMPTIMRMEGANSSMDYQDANQKIDSAALQVYKDGELGGYLDLELSLAEQHEEIEGLESSRKNSIVVCTQLSVRVHAIIEKILSSEGSDLRRALFALKQVFQEDKDLVHAFVALGGLNCLVRVGNIAEYQHYILRALGQVMLYVDGMHGVMQYAPIVQWLYSLIESNYRTVVKTALKLLLVFVEYTESNCYVLVNAIHAVDKSLARMPWSNIMRLLKDYDNADAELVIYSTSLINKILAGLNDQDSFYDETDLLEQQGMEAVIRRYISKPGTDLDLLDQLQLYESVLKYEDGEMEGMRAFAPDNSLRKTQRNRPTDSIERRKSRRHSTGTSPSVIKKVLTSTPKSNLMMHEEVRSSEFNGNLTSSSHDNNSSLETSNITAGQRRRRERAERHRSFLKERQEVEANGIFAVRQNNEAQESDNEERKLLQQLKRDHTVKDLTQKLSNLPTSVSHTEDKNLETRIGEMSGLISKAKEGLAKTKNKGEMSRSSSIDQELKKMQTETKQKSENELHWEELVRNMSRSLQLCDLDFTDLNSEDEKDGLVSRSLSNGVPPPPPPFGGVPPPMMPPAQLPPPPINNYSGYASLPNSINSSFNNSINGTETLKKNKKTVKLFWKEIREDMIVLSGKTIWDELSPANVDTQKLEHLFESRAKDLMTKKQQEMNKSKEVIVLDHKRSNAINIAMTKLPPPRAIKAAILKMDQTIMSREGIDKLLNLLPTDEEKGRILEAQTVNPELPLGSAEQFLLTLASISELAARLKLWAFRLDFDNIEKEIAEPLMDLKQGIDILRNNRTFKCILSTLLSVGTFLNGAPVKGFDIEYLSKVPEVKDTVHKHSLLHHLCHMVMEANQDTTDLYSEIGPVTRASKADFSDLAHNLAQLEIECKASWDRLKLIAKHDCAPQFKQKLVDFLADCAERIIILQIVHRRVLNRYRKFLLWLGVPQHNIPESRPNDFCRIVSEFSLEYRTTRERVQQQLQKKANYRERNKTRGKMIIDTISKYKTKEDCADEQLKELLGTPNNELFEGIATLRRRRPEHQRSPFSRQNEDNFTDADDEILESLVKTATKASGTRTTPRERKRTRHADRKSHRRTLKNGLTEEEKNTVTAFISTY